MRWWPYYNGHYLLNKNTDLIKLFNEHDSNETMDMIDNLIIADGAYDSAHGGQIIKGRATLNKEYSRTGTPTGGTDATGVAFEFDEDGLPVYTDTGEDDFADMIGIAPKTTLE